MFRRSLELALLVATALWVVVVVNRAEEARSHWGTTRTVIVATTDHAIGTTAIDDGFRSAEHPTAMTPQDALETMPNPDDLIVGAILTGDVVTERHLASTRPRTVLVPEGMRALGVPVALGLPPLQPGDQVDVILFAEPLESNGERSRSRQGQVLRVDEATITLAVQAADAGTIADTLVSGRVTLALR